MVLGGGGHLEHLSRWLVLVDQPVPVSHARTEKKSYSLCSLVSLPMLGEIMPRVACMADLWTGPEVREGAEDALPAAGVGVGRPPAAQPLPVVALKGTLSSSSTSYAGNQSKKEANISHGDGF